MNTPFTNWRVTVAVTRRHHRKSCLQGGLKKKVDGSIKKAKINSMHNGESVGFLMDGGAVHYFTKPELDRPNGTIDLKGMLVTRAEESKRKYLNPTRWTWKVIG